MATDGTPSGANGRKSGGGGGSRALRRYGPIAIVLVVIVAVIAITGLVGGGDDADDSQTQAGGESPATDGDRPPTYAEAEAAGTVDDYDWPDTCDTETGRVKIPIANAYPCIAPWDDSEGNGGATSTGVTANEILVAVYQGQPDPLQQAIVEGAGADTDPDLINQTIIDYLKMFEDVVETYGRTVKVITIEASGGPADATAAQADAQKVIDAGAFAAIGGPGQTPAWYQKLVDAKIVCTCGAAESAANIANSAPYLWPTGMTPEQADAHFLELVGTQLAGKNAEFAGDPELQDQPRVFGWIQAQTELDEYKARNEAFADALEEDYDAEITTNYTYLFEPSNAATIASQAIQRMKDAGVTTILISTDPLIPKQITEEATKQDYFPEWVVGPSVLADTTIFGRTFDQQQWTHMIGLGLPAARMERKFGDSYTVYQWYYGREVPVNSQAALTPGPYRLMMGISLAGPNLTPETFESGMFRYPPESGDELTSVRVSWGDKLWPETDHNDADNATAVWWDPDATGEDEAGNPGTGMIRYVDGGKRYLPGDWPTDPLPFFQKEGSVTVYDQNPNPRPDYPPWPGSPADTG
jgi:hypothetical protein